MYRERGGQINIEGQDAYLGPRVNTFDMPVASQLRLIQSWKHIFRSQISNEDVKLKFLSRPVLMDFLVAWGVKLGLHDNELQNPTVSLPVCSLV